MAVSFYRLDLCFCRGGVSMKEERAFYSPFLPRFFGYRSPYDQDQGRRGSGCCFLPSLRALTQCC